MIIKKKPSEIMSEYKDGETFNSNRELYENVAKNERFYIGDQWDGVNAPDMTKPVFNIMKRVVSYYVAMIVSDNIGVHIEPFEENDTTMTEAAIVAKEVERIIEKTKLKAKSRTNVRDACVDGDTGMFISFDPDKDTGQLFKGDIEMDVIDNTHIIFGNPHTYDVQKQPYIIVAQRLFTDQVKDYAKQMDLSDDEIENIKSDDDSMNEAYNNGKTQDNLTTVLTKFWKETKTVEQKDAKGNPQIGLDRKLVTKEIQTVHCMKTTSNVVLKKEIDLDYRLYPFAYMSWEKEKNTYHGRSPITGLIPNQIFINKTFAMCMVYMTSMGFPRVFYDSNKLTQLTNNVQNATAIPNLDIMGKIMDAVKAPDFSNQIINMIDSTVSYTKDFMGASDAALGNIKPENTSAIIAVQQASAVPLEIQRLAFFDFIEDIVRIIIDIIGCDYGTREVKITEEQAKKLGYVENLVDPNTNEQIEKPITSVQLNFDLLKDMNYQLNIDIGQSSYWNETTQVQTMDNLYSKHIINDPVMYLEGIPDKYIANKQQIIDKLKQQQAAQQQIQQMATQMQEAKTAGSSQQIMPAADAGAEPIPQQ